MMWQRVQIRLSPFFLKRPLCLSEAFFLRSFTSRQEVHTKDHSKCFEAELSKIEKPQISKPRNSYKKETKNTRKLREERYAPTPSIRRMPPPSDNLILGNPEVLTEDPEIEKSVGNILPFVVEISYRGSQSETNRCCGIMVDSSGTIITSASLAIFNRDVSLDNIEVDVHPQPRYVRHGFSGVFSLIDFIHGIAIVQCKSHCLLPAAALANPPNIKAGDKIAWFITDSTEHKKLPFRCFVQSGEVVGDEKFRFFCNIGYPVGVVANYNGEVVGMGKYNRVLSTELICQMMTFAKEYEGPVAPWLGMKLKLFRVNYFPFYKGWSVCKVYSGSPAERAGIRGGDSLQRFDGEEFYSVEELSAFLYFKLGKNVVVALFREDTECVLEVTLIPDAKESRYDTFSESVHI